MFSVQQTIADENLEPFAYLDRDGNLRTVPHLKTVSMAIASRMEAGDESAFDEVQTGLADEISSLPGWVAEKFVAAWREHSGVAEGESDASSPSSQGSTARPSKRTSAGTGRSRTPKH